jgi:hypothetical protein
MTAPNQIKPDQNHTQKKFYQHILLSILMGIILTSIALGIGMLGYHHFEGMVWIDAFANAAMILSGMGPLTPLNTFDGKLFAGFYALFSGLAFIVILGIILSPILRRFFRKIHLDTGPR